MQKQLVRLCLSNSSCVSLQYLEIRRYSCGIAPNTEQIILRLNCTELHNLFLDNSLVPCDGGVFAQSELRSHTQ